MQEPKQTKQRAFTLSDQETGRTYCAAHWPARCTTCRWDLYVWLHTDI